MFLVMNAVHFADSQMYIMRGQRCSTVASCAMRHIRIKLANILALSLSKDLLSQIVKVFVRNCKTFDLDMSWNIDVSVESRVALSC